MYIEEYPLCRTKKDASDSTSGATKEQERSISTCANQAYGHVETARAAEYEMCVTPLGAAIATQEPSCETILS